ncbi:hypothetical protein NDU88_003699, partial [Pleurodeles waltl]
GSVSCRRCASAPINLPVVGDLKSSKSSTKAEGKHSNKKKRSSWPKIRVMGFLS